MNSQRREYRTRPEDREARQAPGAPRPGSTGDDGPVPGRRAYDPASGRLGVLQTVLRAGDLLFDPEVTGARVAFLRPEGGGVEWTADADRLRPPEGGDGEPPCDSASPPS